MIQANELRLGNFFTSSIRIEGSWIEKQRFDGDIYRVKPCTFECQDWRMFKPIPLIKEWLLRMGFKNDFIDLTNEIQIIFENNICIISLSDPSETVWGRFPQIKFVHQLQNLYFALTGKEIEISNVSNPI